MKKDFIEISEEIYDETFRLIITEDCNATCPHCFNANMRKGKHMPMDMVYKALSCVEGSSVKLMGGEPTLHPNLNEIIGACHETASVDRVRLFTNGLKKEILEKTTLQPQDSVCYNFYVANLNLTNQNYLWDRKISRTFHVVINTKTDLSKLFIKLRSLAGILKCQTIMTQRLSGVVLSLDTQENIFSNKEELQKRLFSIVRRLRLWGIRHISRDHIIPVCFWTNNETREYLDVYLKHNDSIRCQSTSCASWVGIDGTIRHCNQFPVYCGQLSDITTGAQLTSLYEKAKTFKLKLLKQDEECRDCPHLKTCLGGCFKAYHLDNHFSLDRLKCS